MRRLALACLAWAALGPASAAIALTDDLGHAVHLPAPARRIVTLAPFLTELAFSAGAGDRVVGVSAHSDHPREAGALPEVAHATAVAMEPLVALKPDLVLAWGDSIRPEDLERLRRFGIPTFVAHARRLEDVPRLLEAIGRAAGIDTGARADAFRRRLEGLRATHAQRPPARAFVEIWHRPLMSIAGAHWINEALEICGARNAFADLPGVAPHVSWEELYARDPEVIVGAGSAADAGRFRAQWQDRGTLSAVKAGRLVFVAADLIQRPGLRLAEGIAALCAGIEAVRPRAAAIIHRSPAPPDT